MVFHCLANLLFILLIAGQFHNFLNDWDRQLLQVRRKARVYYELAYCGQIAANRQNLRAAYQWAVRLYQPHSKYLKSRLEALLKDQTIPVNMQDLVSLSELKCFHKEQTGIHSETYRQTNPSIPEVWPNFHYRYAVHQN